MTNKNSVNNSEEEVIENVVVTNATIGAYTHNDSAFHICDKTFENCVFVDLSEFFFQGCVFRNCIITGSLIRQIAGCDFENTLLSYNMIEWIQECNLHYSSLTECIIHDIYYSNFVRCQFSKLQLVKCGLKSSTFKYCMGDWESKLDTFAYIMKGVQVWNNNEWITVQEDDWRQFLCLHGVNIESELD